MPAIIAHVAHARNHRAKRSTGVRAVRAIAGVRETTADVVVFFMRSPGGLIAAGDALAWVRSSGAIASADPRPQRPRAISKERK
jgi:predicted deacylase